MLTGRQLEKSDKFSAEQVNSVRSALESVLSSDAFAGSKRCQDFLRLIVGHALAGELDDLRERMIGAEMFGRPVDYDTSNDAVVRVRATEVRKRLAQYYAQAAQTPDVRIELPPGSYVPEFHWHSLTRAQDEVGTTAPPRVVAPRLRLRPTLAVTTALVSAALALIIWLQFPRKAQSINALRLSLGLPHGRNLTS
jgi:hypothetical protein